MALSYKGLLFRRIAVKAGVTYGRNLEVDVTNVMLHWSADYEDTILKVYRRNKRGYWDVKFVTVFDNSGPMRRTIDWFVDQGLMTIDRGREFTRRGHPLFVMCSDFVRLTDKGLELAKRYLKERDPAPKGQFGTKHYFDTINWEEELK